MTILLENGNETSGQFSISAHVKRLGCALALTALAISARADLIGEETRLAFDVSTRINLNQVNDRSSMLHFLGIDFFKTFSVNGRDVGTLLLQPYLIRAVHLSPHPGLFDDPNDVALQFRNLYYRLPPSSIVRCRYRSAMSSCRMAWSGNMKPIKRFNNLITRWMAGIKQIGD